MSDSNLFYLGSAIKHLRKKFGFTQEQLAERCGKGVTVSYLSKLENGKIKSNPTYSVILKIAEGLGVTPASLLFHAIDVTKLSKNDQVVYEKILDLFHVFSGKEIESSQSKNNSSGAAIAKKSHTNAVTFEPAY